MNGYFVGGNETYGTKTLGDLLGSSTEANMMRLKITLLGLTRTPAEYKIIGFLCEGYQELDIASALKVSRQYVNKTVKTYRNRLTAEQIEDIFSILKEG